MNSLGKVGKINFVEIGWFALHKSVAGYNISFPFVYQDEYEKYLSPIIELIGFQFEKKYESESSVATKIWRGIQEVERQNKDCKASRRVSLRRLPVLYDDWAELRFGRKADRIDLNDPLSAANIGWSLIEKTLQPNAGKDKMLWGLALLGWVAVIYIELRTCKYCFRFAVPGSLFCFRHSQSTSLGINRSEAYGQYRKGREVNELIVLDGNFSPQTNAEEFEFIQSRLVLADYLFFNHPTVEDAAWLREVLRSAPRVLSRLGGDRVLRLSDVELFAHARKTINPLFLSNELWGEELVMAEIYFSFEDKVPDRVRGRPQKGEFRKQIIELAQSGLRPAEVATKLGMSKSNLSNWINRYADVKKAFQ